jgi:hypothetical protein
MPLRGAGRELKTIVGPDQPMHLASERRRRAVAGGHAMPEAIAGVADSCITLHVIRDEWIQR